MVWVNQIRRLAQMEGASAKASTDEVRGIEGSAAQAYFSVFT